MTISQHTASTAHHTIRRIEELSLTAWPSLQTLYDDGWVLRFANGYTRRANSVNPIYPSAVDPSAKIRRCETIYGQRGLPTVFKMTPQAQPSGLDDLLAEAGYTHEAATSVQTLALNQLEAPSLPDVRLSPTCSDDWQAAFCRMNSIPERHTATMRRMLESIPAQTCYAALYAGESLAAVGLGVADGGYVGLFDIVTAPELRRQGFGRQLVLHLLGWGQSAGAQTAYLQVMYNNDPARQLYAALGFREVYPYWYRVKQS